MGNYLCGSGGKQHKAQVQDVWQDPPFKVVRPDGTIEVFRRTVTACELISQHPNHSVFHSSAMLGPPIPTSALPPNKELQGGRLYYVLPANSSLQQKGQALPQASFKRPPGGVVPVSKLTVANSPPGSTAGYPQMIVGPIVLHSQDIPWKPRLETINEVCDSSGCHIQSLMRITQKENC